MYFMDSLNGLALVILTSYNQRRTLVECSFIFLLITQPLHTNTLRESTVTL